MKKLCHEIIFSESEMISINNKLLLVLLKDYFCSLVLLADVKLQERQKLASFRLAQQGM